MALPPFPDTTATLDEMRALIQRPITINVKVQGTPCPACDLDPITGTSTDSFCATCSGLYWINTISGYSTSGHVRWMGADQPLYTPGGTIDIGDCIVTLKYTSTNLTNVQNSDHFIVDDRDLYVKDYVMKGVRQLNRIRVILKEDSE
jgi:hypothetical protein